MRSHRRQNRRLRARRSRCAAAAQSRPARSPVATRPATDAPERPASSGESSANPSAISPTPLARVARSPASSSMPRRRASRTIRRRTEATSCAISPAEGGGRGAKRAPPPGVGTKTPSATRPWKWTFRLRAAPDRWIAVTEPPTPPRRPRRRARRRCRPRTARMKTASTARHRRWSQAMAYRSRQGQVSTHWRMGRPPSTESTRCIERSAMRRPQHDGQKPRPLQEKGTRISARQPSHRKRTKPRAKLPHARKSRSSRSTKAGTPAPSARRRVASRNSSRCDWTTSKSGLAVGERGT